MAVTEIGDHNPIDRLNEIAANQPIDVVAARVTLTDAVDFMRTSENKANDARAIATSLGAVVTNLTLEQPPRQQESVEFAAHAATYRTVAESLEATTPPQTVPTKTQGKKQSGAKS